MKLKMISAVAAILLLGCTQPSAASESLAPIRMNQLGFQASSAKIAIIPNPSKQPLAWKLLDPRGQVAASGVTRVAGDDPASGDHIHVADFSSVRKEGNGYRLTVGTSASRPFAIQRDIYARLPYDALAYFYHNRAGTPIEARFVGERWARPAGHRPEKASCFAGKGTQGNDWRGCDYELDVTGGWYDAGDQGKYVVNGGIALWTLLNLYEREQKRGSGVFADGTAAIPERGNGVADLLDEARWEMEFLLRMQVPAGKKAFVPIGVARPAPSMAFTEIDASGMTHHKVADLNWTKLPTAPHEDREKRVLYPPTTGATLNLAATAAQCARIWRGIDPAFSARCLTAAERAWEAAGRNPKVYAAGDFTGSGGYGDDNVNDEFYWAASELFITTGKDVYRTALTQSPHSKANVAPEFSWSHVATLGTLSLLGSSNKLDAAEISVLRKSITSAADSYVADAATQGYVIPYAPPGYPWGSNSSILNRAITLAFAYDISREPRYRDAAASAMDYLLGRNPLDQSYISGYGARPMKHPHHRFWANQLDPAFPPPPPGALSGGPNSMFGGDDIFRALRGKCAPQKCWSDETMTPSMNEVAINWNAPLVWVATFLNDTP